MRPHGSPEALEQRRRRVVALLKQKYEVDGMRVIICQATGTWGPHMLI